MLRTSVQWLCEGRQMSSKARAYSRAKQKRIPVFKLVHALLKVHQPILDVPHSLHCHDESAAAGCAVVKVVGAASTGKAAA